MMFTDTFDRPMPPGFEGQSVPIHVKTEESVVDIIMEIRKELTCQQEVVAELGAVVIVPPDKELCEAGSMNGDNSLRFLLRGIRNTIVDNNRNIYSIKKVLQNNLPPGEITLR